MLVDDIYDELNLSTPFTTGGETFTLRKFFAPDTPDAVIVVEEELGRSDILAMGASLAAPVREQHMLTVRVRSPRSRYDLGRTMAETVHVLLARLNKTINGRDYYLKVVSPPHRSEKGQDRNERWEIVARYLVMKERG